MYPLKQLGRELINSLFLMAGMPYEVRRKIPPGNIDCVKLALAYYCKINPRLTLVQIGACDGVSCDPVYDFIKKGEIQAVLVEPIESSFVKLKKAYDRVTNVEFIQAAIAEKDGLSTLYKVKESGRWADSKWIPQGWASFNKLHLIKLGVKPDEIEEVTVPCMTLGTLMNKINLNKIDFIQVDTEGYDAVIVDMALNLSNLPDCINFENCHINQQARDKLFCKLQESGYSWIHDEYNTLALHGRLTSCWT